MQVCFERPELSEAIGPPQAGALSGELVKSLTGLSLLPEKGILVTCSSHQTSPAKQHPTAPQTTGMLRHEKNGVQAVSIVRLSRPDLLEAVPSR